MTATDLIFALLAVAAVCIVVSGVFNREPVDELTTCGCGTDAGPPCPCPHGAPLCAPCEECGRS